MSSPRPLTTRPLGPLVLLLLLGAATLALAQQPEFPSALGGSALPQSLVSIEVSFPTVGESAVSGLVKVTIEPGWHINSARPLDSFAIPTELLIESPALRIERIDYPAHELHKFSFNEGKELAVYQNTIGIPFTATKLAASGPVRLSLRYQACNDRLCLPPKSAVLDANFTGQSSGVALQPAAGSGFVPLASAPRGKGALWSSDVQSTFSSRGLPLTLLVVFVLGLALNLTPCVYPLIPITIAFFSSQSEGRRGRRALLALCYVLGIAVTYSALGVFSALSGRLFGAWLQLPAVLVFFALLMLVMAASMFGLFDIRVPHFITDRAGGRVGYAGSLTMGLLVGIVAAPCVGPFVISLIALVGQIGSPALGFLLFFVLALGLGVPYLLLGIFSGGLASIPRSGAWMVQIKQAMGFILIAMAVYFVRPLIGDELYQWGMALSLLLGAVYLLMTRGGAREGGTALRIACAVLLAAGGLWFALQRSEEGLRWKPYAKETVAAASSRQQPVMIDFYADWCLPCKELDAKTFTDERVRVEGKRFMRLKVNLTNADDPLSSELSKQYAILGVPTIVFLDGLGKEVTAARLTGFEGPGRFLERMQGVR